MTRETEPKGNAFTHVFDENGRVVYVSDEEGGKTSLGQQVQTTTGEVVTTVTSAEGNVMTHTDRDLVDEAMTSTLAVSGIAAPTQYVRSTDGLKSTVTLPDLTVEEFQKSLDPENKFEFLKQLSVTTPSGLKAEVDQGRTYADTDLDGKKDRVFVTTALNGKTTEMVHNVLTSQRSVTTPMGRVVTASYDPATLLTSKVSVPGLLDTTYQYDAKGRLTGIQAGTRHSAYTYDTLGNLASYKDPLNRTTTYDYDAVGQTTAIHRPDGTVIRFDYDANGNVTVLTNPSAKDHTFTYNKVNYPVSYKPPLSTATSYVYDRDKRLKSITLPSGKRLTSVYTGVLLTQMQTPEGNIGLTYSSAGQLSAVSRGGESLTYTYDGSLLKSATSAGTLAQAISYAYNNDFKLTGITYAGATSARGYDNDGLLTSAGGFAVTRDAQNGLPTAVAGGALSLSRTFNGFAEVTNQTTTVNSAAAGSFTLTYNDNGQIATKSETVAGITSSYVYTYDEAGRLTQVQKDGVVVEQYGYTGVDPLGTRTSEMNTLRGIPTRSLTYNAEDQLLTAGTATYQYDADGKLSKKVDGANSTTYTYSTRGELTNVVLPGKSIDYVYDPLGRRIAKQVNGVTTEKYLWSGMTRLLAVYDDSNNLLERFEYADSRMPVSMSKGGATYYLTYDQVGSLRAVTDATGTVVKRIDFDTFGNILADSNPALSIPFGFAGGLQDRDTNLVRFGYRDYDPATGRWTAKDPIGFDGGDTDLYGYLESDPVNFIDPLGLYWMLPPGWDVKGPGKFSPVPCANNALQNPPESPLDIVLAFSPMGEGKAFKEVMREIPWNKVVQVTKEVIKESGAKQIMRHYKLGDKTVAVIHEIWERMGDVWEIIHRDFKGPWPE